MHTITRYMRVRILLSDVAAGLANYNTKLHFVMLFASSWLVRRHTFMVGEDTSWNFYSASRFDITCCGFQEKERFLRHFIA